MEIIRTLRLDKKNSRGYCPIRITCYFEGKRVFLSPGISIEEKNWDENKKKIKGRAPFALEQNEALDNWTTQAGKVYYQAQIDNQSLSAEEFRARVEAICKPDRIRTEPPKSPSAPGSSFFALLDAWLTHKSESYSRSTKKKLSDSSMRSLRNLHYHLRGYAVSRGKELSLATMDEKFYNNFKSYLLQENSRKESEGSLSPNTASALISKLKSFLSWCEDEGHPVNRRYRRWEASFSYAGVDALTPQEVRELWQFDFQTQQVTDYIIALQKQKTRKTGDRDSVEYRRRVYEEIRDAFMFGIATGLHILDAFQVDHHHVHNDVIIIPRSKNFNSCYIPLIDDELFHAREIIEKYRHWKGRPGRVCRLIPTNWHMNKYLEEIQQLVGIALSRMKITYKIARKTFVTLKIYQGVPARLIMQSTGHKTEHSFNRYLGVDVEELKRQYQLISDRQKLAG